MHAMCFFFSGVALRGNSGEVLFAKAKGMKTRCTPDVIVCVCVFNWQPQTLKDDTVTMNAGDFLKARREEVPRTQCSHSTLLVTASRQPT